MVRSSTAGLSLLATLALSAPALANTVVLPPLVSNGATEKTVVNVHQLMSSELEFMSEVGGVKEVARPPFLDAACVANDGCLASVVSSSGGDSLLTGVITDQGGTLILDLVYFSGGRTARRQAYTVTGGATGLANKMTGMLNEMLTGKGTASQEAAAAPSASTFSAALDDGDDFFAAAPASAQRAPAPASNPFALDDGLVDVGPSPQELARQQAEQEARMRAEQEARMRAEQEARLRADQEARARAEQEARMRADEEARRRAEEDARMRADQEARQRAEAEARARAEAEARARAEEEGRRLAAEQEIARKRAENERLRLEEEARRAAEEQARAQAARSAAPAPAMGGINFASSADKMTAEQIDAVIKFGAPSPGQGAAAPSAYSAASYTPPPAYTPPATAAYTPPAPVAGTAAYTPPAAAGYTPPAPSYSPPSQPYAPPPSYAAAPSYSAPAPAYAPPTGASGYGQPAPTYAPAPSRGGAADPGLALEEQELASLENPGLMDLDSDKKSRGKSNQACGSSQATIDRATPKTMQISVRGGYSKYFAFDFITAGGEVGVPLTKGLMAVAGVEAYSVQRELPPEYQVPGQPIFTWNTIYPINLGVAYKIQTGSMFVPYVGADAIFVQYYKDDIGADWAGGARARAGVDVMLVQNFGLNANLAVGGWTGKNWTLIDATLGNSGLLPQINAGTVIAF